ncbi:MFS general substrate transporter [Lentinula aff. lateritia]|uniref:MFS general substrate transporter n=1 Tax=Lentinula aff. lateritia TaxID=2804960 RepID=A0ACC1TI91_9AGAR|nr:MFS general substrate transporter [Lentinula aff. lateritia]
MQDKVEARVEDTQGTTNMETVHSMEVPEGGLTAWMTVTGAWLVLFGTFGYLYSFGVYQDFYTREYLSGHSPSSIAWIGSIQLMMPFALGIVSGKIFDQGGFHQIEIIGCLLFTFSLFMLSLAKPLQYYQIFLSQGLGMGIGLGLTFIPTISITVHHFHRRRGLASGIALSGSSIGGMIFPISMLTAFLCCSKFDDSSDYSAEVKCSSLLRLFFFHIPITITCCFDSEKYSALISSMGLYFPLIYIQLYAIQHQVDSDLAFYSIAIMNGASSVGRVLGNHLADIYGPFNIQVPCTLITGATIWAVLGVHNTSSLITISIFYGLASGAWLALAFTALASLAKRTDEVGARVGLALALSSFGSLGAAPIQGALLQANFLWIRPIAFSSSVMCGGTFIFAITRTLQSWRHKSQKV